jgi:pyrroloquinoline-quinone synthase
MDLHLAMLEETKEKLIERLHVHSFLHRCREGAVTLDELKLFLVQQGIYSGYFTRYLCALMANLPSSGHVLRLANNLCEELGLTAESTTPHSTVYRSMLGHFNLTLDGVRPLLGTRRLIDTMFDHCRDPNVARGLGALCLGAEALVPTVYSDIIAGFEACGARPATLEFFYVHVECDHGHSDTMWDIMLELARRDPDQVGLMLSAGNAMVDARLDFFNSIERTYGPTTQARAVDASLALPNLGGAAS